jgi:hypothetical protein
MNIVDTHVQNIRPAPNGHKMLGNVSFYIRGGMGDRCDVMNFECHCNIPLDDSSDQRLSQIKQDLKTDALRQAKRMPEFRSGEDKLAFLTPQERYIA